VEVFFQVKFKPMRSISRRDFLKLGGLAIGGLAFTNFSPQTAELDGVDLVRVAYHSVSVYSQPSDQADIVHSWVRDDLVHVYETVEADAPQYNPIWYRVFGGYMHRGRLQKVRLHYNNPVGSLSRRRSLAEVTVPYTQPYRYNQWNGWFPVFRMYSSSLHWITAIDTGPDGRAWYRILDEADKNIEYFVPAAHLRLVADDEYSTLSPQLPVEGKRIDVDLKVQTLVCYEGEQDVHRADISSGLFGLYPTPIGRFNIMVKLPARDMTGSERFASDEENTLSGVPWCSFFTSAGHAFHGTFWHDNFGLPMSHGCINMRNEDARWLFRWSRPHAGGAEIDQNTLDVRGYGTIVDIHY
jgi:hypothetical protein